MTTVTISLPDSLKAFIDGQLATKSYGNVSQYFLAACCARPRHGKKKPAWKPCC